MSSKMKVKTQVRPQEQTQKEPCRHYWVIEVANGPASRGVCKFCGTKKEFFNVFPEYNPIKKNQRKSPLDLPELSDVTVESKS
jgi:hypothetical protein